MKKPTSRGLAPLLEDELRSEYDFDYSEAKPNRFADELTQDCVTVVLEPDVASVFTDAASVNALLRSVIAALPEVPTTTKRRKKRPNNL